MNLLIAANKGDLPLLIRYYEQKINFNWKDYDGRTALHLAIEGGRLNVVKFLVEKCQVKYKIMKIFMFPTTLSENCLQLYFNPLPKIFLGLEEYTIEQ